MDDRSESATPSPEGERHAYHAVTRSFAAVILGLLLYVLSVGPVARFYRNSYHVPPGLVRFYDPVFKFCRGRILNFYIFEVWGLGRSPSSRYSTDQNLQSVVSYRKPDRHIFYYIKDLATPEPSPTPPINLKTNRPSRTNDQSRLQEQTARNRL